jgi:alcohol dehydrogenase class IV
MTLHQFSFPTAITFGPGARDLLVDHLRAHDVSRPLVVTDKGVGALGLFTDLVANLAAGGLEPLPFDGVWGNPVKSQVSAGVEAYQAHQADGIVGIGGGAALDVAKAIALMATHPGDLFDYEDEMPGARPIGPVPHLVALPTTAGTGSEVGRSAVISDDVTHVKKIIFSPHLLADAVLADPELTIDLPAAITAATGVDALTHNIEAYLARNYNPICDGIALEGLRLGAANLARAVANPHDVEARGAMLMSSMMGAIAFQKGLGIVHSTAHALGTVADLHHGLANAVMIDHALPFNVETSAGRFTVMAQTVGLDDPSSDGFLRWLADLKAEIGMPRSLAATGVEPGDLERLCDVAIADGCHVNNPRPVNRDDFRRIFTEAFA